MTQKRSELHHKNNKNKKDNKPKKSFSYGKVIAGALILGVLCVGVLFYTAWNRTISFAPESSASGNVLSQQTTTTTTQTTSTLVVTSRGVRNEQTTQSSSSTSRATQEETYSTVRTENNTAERLDELGNSRLEFDSLDDAYDYGVKVLNSPELLKQLTDRGYRGYVVRSIRWSDGTLTYTIDWQ